MDSYRRDSVSEEDDERNVDLATRFEYCAARGPSDTWANLGPWAAVYPQPNSYFIHIRASLWSIAGLR